MNMFDAGPFVQNIYAGEASGAGNLLIELDAGSYWPNKTPGSYRPNRTPPLPTRDGAGPALCTRPHCAS